MSLITPAEREFAIMRAGYVRDSVVLATFRSGLRRRVNPATNTLFTEDEIALATRKGSRFWIGAQAVDEYGQGRQRNALWLANQIRMDRASSYWLKEYHGKPIGVLELLPTGATGNVLVLGTPGTIVVGSTTIGASGVYTARDANGAVYQVFIANELDAEGEATVTMRAVTTGAATNLPVGSVLTWITKDPGMDPTCAVVGDDFRNGTDRETDAEYLDRVVSEKRYKPAAGNDAQMRAWARSASNAIENGFVYACALYAGSTMVAITSKRAGGIGPLARIPGAGVLADAIAYLVPPLSPVMPPRSWVIPVVPQSEPSDLVLKMVLQRGTSAGWRDATPWPAYHATTPAITAVGSTTEFDVTCPGDATLPGQLALATLSGANAPHIMLWKETTSRFVVMQVDSIEDLGSNVFRVTLDAEPSDITPAIGMIVCPDVARRDIIAQAVETYFDGLGPGHLFDLDNDSRGGRCVRFPDVSEEYPYRAGSAVATRVIEALGGSSADAELASISLAEPTYPAPEDLILGPNMLTLGKVGVFEI